MTKYFCHDPENLKLVLGTESEAAESFKEVCSSKSSQEALSAMIAKGDALAEDVSKAMAKGEALAEAVTQDIARAIRGQSDTTIRTGSGKITVTSKRSLTEEEAKSIEKQAAKALAKGEALVETVARDVAEAMAKGEATVKTEPGKITVTTKREMTEEEAKAMNENIAKAMAEAGLPVPDFEGGMPPEFVQQSAMAIAQAQELKGEPLTAVEAAEALAKAGVMSAIEGAAEDQTLAETAMQVIAEREMTEAEVKSLDEQAAKGQALAETVTQDIAEALAKGEATVITEPGKITVTTTKEMTEEDAMAMTKNVTKAMAEAGLPVPNFEDGIPGMPSGFVMPGMPEGVPEMPPGFELPGMPADFAEKAAQMMASGGAPPEDFHKGFQEDLEAAVASAAPGTEVTVKKEFTTNIEGQEPVHMKQEETVTVP